MRVQMDTGGNRMIGDVAGFLEGAMALQNVGVSVYPGAPPVIKDDSVVIPPRLFRDAGVPRLP